MRLGVLSEADVECDRQLKQYLQSARIAARVPSAGREAKGRLKEKKGNAPQFGLREGLLRMTGTDLTRIDSIDVMTATTGKHCRRVAHP